MQLLPAITLRKYIKHYLWVQKSPQTNGQLHVFGDGNPGIVFCFQGCLYEDALLQMPLPPIFAYGQISRHRAIYALDTVHLLIVVLHPFTLSALLRTSANLLADLILDETHLFPGARRDEAAQLVQQETLAGRVGSLNQLMSKTFYGERTTTQQIIASTISHITKLEGKVSALELTGFTGYGERYLEKQFKEHVGLSPIKFARITRMLGYIKSLQSVNTLSTYTERAYQAGFFDQAHLNHEFRKLTGTTPSVFARQRQPLALNFFTIKN